ncbi:MAG: hypothetical protein KC586_10395, partial [Myxococcales bacterium]|nr:hypothetical protein [Myxococcales bacterium]
VSGSPSTAFSNSSIPTSGGPNAFVAPFWDDLRPNSGADVTTFVQGSAGSQRLVVQWTNWRATSTADSQQLTFQAHLVEGSNAIELHYCSMTGMSGSLHTGSSASIGVENTAGTAGLQISYDTADAVATGSGFRITAP